MQLGLNGGFRSGSQCVMHRVASRVATSAGTLLTCGLGVSLQCVLLARVQVGHSREWQTDGSILGVMEDACASGRLSARVVDIPYSTSRRFGTYLH